MPSYLDLMLTTKKIPKFCRGRRCDKLVGFKTRSELFRLLLGHVLMIVSPCRLALYSPKPNAVLFERGLVFVRPGREVVQVFDVTFPMRLAKAECGWNL